MTANAIRREAARHAGHNDLLSWRLQDLANAREWAETLMKKAAAILAGTTTANGDGSPSDRTTRDQRN